MKIKNITDDELCNTMVAVLFAGYSTISVLIPWILKYLHNNPTVQDAIQVLILLATLLTAVLGSQMTQSLKEQILAIFSNDLEKKNRRGP